MNCHTKAYMLRLMLLLAIISFVSLGCSQPSVTDLDSSEQTYLDTRLVVGVVVQDEDAALVKHMQVKLVGGNLTEPMTLKLQHKEGQWVGALNSPTLAGSGRTLEAIATNEKGEVLFDGKLSSVKVEQNTSKTVLLVLRSKLLPIPFFNTAPHISSLSASSYQLGPSQTIELTGVAGDADGKTLKYTWAGQGEFSNPNALNTEWTAPLAEGTFQLSLTVEDEDGATAALSVIVEVDEAYLLRSEAKKPKKPKKPKTGKVSVTAEFNTWPTVSKIWADLGSLQPGQQTQLYSLVQDPDFDPLVYRWTDSCGGSFDDATKIDPKWTAPAQAPANNKCNLRLRVRDRMGGVGLGRLRVLVGFQTQINLSPQITSTLQTEEVVQRGQQIVFRVNAKDPEGTTLRFRWFSSRGRLTRPPTNTAISSEITWTAPNRLGAQTITARVKDATGAESFVQFVIQVQ